MPSRRSKLEIVLCVLSTVRDGVDKPTRIMYASNLSWKPTQKVLSNLVEQGLLNVSRSTEGKRSRRRYEITEKGLNVLRYFNNARGLIDIEAIT